ncbi:gamma-glutamylaminecyclotransferase [Trichonephila clavipes]|nr:gamma-glutamylaminecyclotransferase [Trichonephila clavipes]
MKPQFHVMFLQLSVGFGGEISGPTHSLTFKKHIDYLAEKFWGRIHLAISLVGRRSPLSLENKVADSAPSYNLWISRMRSRSHHPHEKDLSNSKQNTPRHDERTLSTEGDSPYQYLVFVYGTLKRNEPNYDLVADPSKGKALFEGMARTVQKYPLVIASRYNIPYLLYREGVGKNVIGELYKIDEAMLAVMDELECNGKYYQRIQIEVQPFGPEGDKGSPVKPWIYFLMNFREHLLDLPHLEDYSSKGPHGLEYLPETSESIWNKPIERFQKLEISSKCQSHAEAVEYLLVFD